MSCSACTVSYNATVCFLWYRAPQSKEAGEHPGMGGRAEGTPGYQVLHSAGLRKQRSIRLKRWAGGNLHH